MPPRFADHGDTQIVTQGCRPSSSLFHEILDNLEHFFLASLFGLHRPLVNHALALLENNLEGHLLATCRNDIDSYKRHLVLLVQRCVSSHSIEASRKRGTAPALKIDAARTCLR